MRRKGSETEKRAHIEVRVLSKVSITLSFCKQRKYELLIPNIVPVEFELMEAVKEVDVFVVVVKQHPLPRPRRMHVTG